MVSSSGGIFTEIAKSVFRKGGMVAGARFTDGFSVEHVLIDSERDIDQLRKSKYTQSDISSVLQQMTDALNIGKTVLFTGTPCQCAAVRSYLSKPYGNLILCDLICRGVNSGKIFREYLDRLESEYSSRVREIKMREKDGGWLNWGIRITFENGKEYFSYRKSDPFLAGYLAGEYLRECCYQCRFKGVSRPVDMTIGDFWGIDLEASQMERGVSVVLVHSDKGKALFKSIAGQIHCEKRGIDEVIPGNPMLIMSAQNTGGAGHA